MEHLLDELRIHEAPGLRLCWIESQGPVVNEQVGPNDEMLRGFVYDDGPQPEWHGSDAGLFEQLARGRLVIGFTPAQVWLQSSFDRSLPFEVFMLFRAVQPDDADMYRSIRRSALDEVPQFVGPLAEREASMDLGELRQQLASYPAQGVHVFGCFMSGRGAAVAAMTRRLDAKYAHKLFLWGMYVLPSHRGQAIGRHFVGHLIGFAKQQPGVRFVTLQVTTTNAPARELYQRNGFKSYGVEPSALFLNGDFLDFEMMQLDLEQGPV